MIVEYPVGCLLRLDSFPSGKVWYAMVAGIHENGDGAYLFPAKLLFESEKCYNERGAVRAQSENLVRMCRLDAGGFVEKIPKALENLEYGDTGRWALEADPARPTYLRWDVLEKMGAEPVSPYLCPEWLVVESWDHPWSEQLELQKAFMGCGDDSSDVFESESECRVYIPRLDSRLTDAMAALMPAPADGEDNELDNDKDGDQYGG